jgi:hypothetical protein
MAQMSKAAVLGMVHEHWPSHLYSRQQAILTDKWVRGEQYDLSDSSENFDFPDSGWDHFGGQVFQPDHRSAEHVDLESRTPTPWGGLVVTSLAQTAYVDGIRRAGQNENLAQWETLRANKWDAKQTAIHRTTIGLSTAYGITMPGKNPLTGDKMTKMMARSPKRMSAFYQDDNDEWCTFAIDATQVFETAESGLGVGTRIQKGWFVEVYDELVVHRISCTGDGRDLKDWTYIDYEEHGVPVPPVARCVNRIDLDGRATGEIEPILPMLRRIDQGMFDRLIVQRFGAWKVRYIAGMAKPSNQTQADVQAMRLRIEDLLISSDNQTKFGTLDATDISGYIAGTDADLRMLAAITQTPPHHLLGLSSNLQAESLAAAESGLQRKSVDFKVNAGQFHEDMTRLVAIIEGDKATASATDLKVRWRDTESRSLVQAAQALGALAIQLKVPVEMLWEKVPGWDDSDTERAKKLIETGGVEQLLADIASQMKADEAQQAADIAQSAQTAQKTAPNQSQAKPSGTQK